MKSLKTAEGRIWGPGLTSKHFMYYEDMQALPGVPVM